MKVLAGGLATVDQDTASPNKTSRRPPFFQFDKPLFDAMLKQLPGVEMKVAFAVERRTRGHYDRESAEVSVSLIVEMTDCSKTSVIHARRRLIEEGVLVEVIPPSSRQGAHLKVNRDPSRWGAFSEPHKGLTSAIGGYETTPQGSTIDTSGGQETAPPGVAKQDQLDNSDIYEDPLELIRPAGDRLEESPAGRTNAFQEGMRLGGPDWLRGKLDCLPADEPTELAVRPNSNSQKGDQPNEQ